MPSLADLGVTVSRTLKTSSAEIGGIEVSNKATTELVLGLPRPATIIAGFCKEGVGRKLLKLFKKELQTGDVSFDDAVYISTDTMDATAAWLAKPELRMAILEIVESGGSIEISGSVVKAELPTHDESDDPALVRVIEALLVAE